MHNFNKYNLTLRFSPIQFSIFNFIKHHLSFSTCTFQISFKLTNQFLGRSHEFVYTVIISQINLSWS